MLRSPLPWYNSGVNKVLHRNQTINPTTMNCAEAMARDLYNVCHQKILTSQQPYLTVKLNNC